MEIFYEQRRKITTYFFLGGATLHSGLNFKFGTHRIFGLIMPKIQWVNFPYVIIIIDEVLIGGP